jgi:hypothetical protein
MGISYASGFLQLDAAVVIRWEGQVPESNGIESPRVNCWKVLLASGCLSAATQCTGFGAELP